ncbi:MAG TPA: DUF1272 domain-containing protein [Propionibacteriaceae bacterium]|nr:DUF1272 domain-containing protein [Propionibacteriaceae bacterium]
MLELRPNCECCDVDLPPSAPDAMICTFECTWCAACVEECLHGVCPNCGGNIERRPIRPPEALVASPASTVRVVQEGLHRGPGGQTRCARGG